MGIIVALGFRLLVEVESVVEVVEVVEIAEIAEVVGERGAEVVEGLLEDGPTVLPMAV